MAKQNNIKINIPVENDYIIKTLEKYGRTVYKNNKLHKRLSSILKNYTQKNMIYFNTQKSTKINIITIKPGYRLKRTDNKIRIYRTE